MGIRVQHPIGQRFHHLIVVSRVSIKRSSHYNCICDCGRETTVRRDHLLTGRSQSCGCGRIKHGLYRGASVPGEATWRSMKSRCNNPRDKDYNNYGGRGIRVCAEWEQLPAFLRDMGHPPFRGASLDRIDVNGNYEPSNCRWADATTQARNQRRNVLTADVVRNIRADHENGLSVRQLATKYGAHVSTVADAVLGRTWVLPDKRRIAA